MANPLARSFGNVAELYEYGRPSWPGDAVDLVALSKQATVLDLGAGTGKLTRVLVDRFEHVVAVEPDPAMRAVLEREVPAADARDGSAERIPLADASVDAAFVAEAFHWFDWQGAVDELARVLRPGGTLALLWRTFPYGGWEPAVPEAVGEALDRRFAMAIGPPGIHIYEAGVWREPFADAPFEPLRLEQFETAHVATREQLIANWLSVSSIAALPGEERELLAAELTELIEPGDYRLPTRVDAHVTRRI